MLEYEVNMTKTGSIILCALTALVLCSCGQGANKKPTATEADAPIPFFSDASADLEPYRLCEAVLTSEEGMMSAFPDSTDSFFDEPTPVTEAFYFPADDIRDERLAQTVQLRYNYAALFNRVIHSYEWFQRMSTGIDEEESPITRKDTLEWIRYARPALTPAFINSALPDTKARAHAARLMRAYDRFDGKDGEDDPFSWAVAGYTGALEGLPELVGKEDLDGFEDGFWDWYDKRNVVPEIDTLIRMNMHGYEGVQPTEEQLENMRRDIEADKDIDRRTVLALEYVKFDHGNGAPLLGEILESRVYTKYLLEAWISWRANVQMNHSPSSFGVIPNNYYDKVRTLCLDTMLRHCLETEDKNTECLIENLIFCEILHRMGGIYGNSSLTTLVELANEEFIHPRLLETNEEE